MALFRMANPPAVQVADSDRLSVIVRELTKVYTRERAGWKVGENDLIMANDGISLEIKRGEIFGLLGPNGAGKTTFVNQLLGLSRPTSGSIVIEGVDVLRQPTAVKAITSYLPQKGIAFEQIEVQQALSFAGQLKGLSKQAAHLQAQQLIDWLDLGEVVNRYPRRLSGGMRRLVGLAIALMGQPRLLVLDEPTNELDPVRRKQVWEIIKKINRQRNSTCLLVTHNVLEAESILDRTAIINEGKIVALGTPGELKQQVSKEARLDISLKSSVMANNPGEVETKIKAAFAFAQIDLAKLIRFVKSSDDPLKWSVYLPVEHSGVAINELVRNLGLSNLDDFKLSLASLEDVYVGLLGTPGENPISSGKS